VWEVAQKPLADNGLCLIHTTIIEEGRYYLKSILMHSSGQYISGLTPLLLAKNDMQAIGSALSYSKRYATCSMLGIVAEVEDKLKDYYKDDDGEAAVGRGVVPEKSSFEIDPKKCAVFGNGGRITLDQIKELTIAINNCFDPAYASSEICKISGITDISKIPANRFPGALEWVRSLSKKAVK
jgi:hypothetical protein